MHGLVVSRAWGSHAWLKIMSRDHMHCFIRSRASWSHACFENDWSGLSVGSCRESCVGMGCRHGFVLVMHGLVLVWVELGMGWC